ncbi:MAG: gamma-glutamyl-gamma-aminobutyrate hydrolase family protein [Pseudomonadota bacterium]
MHIGILETGRPPEEFGDSFPDYPRAFELLLSSSAPDWRFGAYAALDGELPESPDACDAWLVTGSKYGAYDDEPWIERLEAFLREAYAARAPLVGICFGHQLLAQALGGRVVKSEKGWGVGVHEYAIEHQADWMQSETRAPSRFAIQAFHQDQVVALPPDAKVIATSAFCPNALLAYAHTNRRYAALSFQGHPEFAEDYVRALLESRRGNVVPEAVADAALSGVSSSIDQALSARWIAEFIRRSVAER